MSLADPATVTSFDLDKYDVTVGRFRQFVNAWNGGWRPLASSGKHTYLNAGQGLANAAAPGTYEAGWVASDNGNVAPTTDNLTCNPADHSYSTWTASTGSNESLPITCANWYEAYAFCIWDGGFLPSEAEWGYAAAGGNQQRDYPWGSTDPGIGNQYAIYECYYPSGPGSACTGMANIAPVGTAMLGLGLWGQVDLAGNVAVWVLDEYAAYVDPCEDCAYLTGGNIRVVRGGDFDEDTSQLHPGPPNRNAGPPTERGWGQGFRCARAP
jgi:formylglycine-generating enzyme required for sulfatase activity